MGHYIGPEHDDVQAGFNGRPLDSFLDSLSAGNQVVSIGS